MASSTPSKTLRLALDWTPNTLHTGLFLAQQKGYYASASLSIDLLPPNAAYTETPARRVLNGSADLCIVPSESCLAYAESGKMDLVAIYAICQSDASAIASRRADLKDVATYGSYNARYEDGTVRAMVDHAGGHGASLEIDGAVGKLSLFDKVKSGEVDATWVFTPWEGVEAEMAGVQGLHYFRPGDYGVPYGYSPVIAVRKGAVDDEVLRAFVAQTKRGYGEAMADVDAAVGALHGHCIPERTREFLSRSQERINPFYGTKDELGKMGESRWETWLNWLREKELLKDATAVRVQDLFTNRYHD